MTQINRPGEIVLLAEANNDNVWREDHLNWDHYNDRSGARIEKHHKTGNNFLYGDTHVRYHRDTGVNAPGQRGVPSFPFHWVPLSNMQGSDSGRGGAGGRPGR